MTDEALSALRPGDWRHAKWCRVERGEEEVVCNCGLAVFRSTYIAALPAASPALDVSILADAIRSAGPNPEEIAAEYARLAEQEVADRSDDGRDDYDQYGPGR
jgi:hypothetical protein